MHAIMVLRCTLKDKIHICVLCLLFCSLVKVMCEYTRLPAMLWGGGGGRVRKAIFIEQLKDKFNKY